MTKITDEEVLQTSMGTSIGEYAETLAKQGRPEGRLVMHDTEGKPVAALVLMTGDVAERLQHLDRFKETPTDRYTRRLQ